MRTITPSTSCRLFGTILATCHRRVFSAAIAARFVIANCCWNLVIILGCDVKKNPLLLCRFRVLH